jgi:ribonuclease HI
MKVVVFTDGACTNNGKSKARAAWAVWFPDHESISAADFVPADENQTNQRAELTAIRNAVKIVEKNFSNDTDLHIYTDSQYSQDCLTKWLPAWVSNDWKTRQGKPVCHRDLIEETANMLSIFKSYTIIHVEAHTGGIDYNSKNNAIADRMATKILNPHEEIKVISNTEAPIEGIPISLMGPPVSDSVLIEWCRSNLSMLDTQALNSALISALSKTVKKKGFELVKQKLHRTTNYRLVASNLITGTAIITKEEEE